MYVMHLVKENSLCFLLTAINTDILYDEFIQISITQDVDIYGIHSERMNICYIFSLLLYYFKSWSSKCLSGNFNIT